MRPAGRDLVALAGFVALCAAVSAAGAAITATSVGTWYQTLAKPAFNPPDRVFAPVWTTLFVMIALAGWRTWRRAGLAQPAFAAYAAQLALNLGWSFLFFGLRRIDLALAEIVVLLAAIVVNLVLFARIDRASAWLLAPYLLWVAFAAVLTGAVWRLNP